MVAPSDTPATWCHLLSRVGVAMLQTFTVVMAVSFLNSTVPSFICRVMLSPALRRLALVPTTVDARNQTDTENTLASFNPGGRGSRVTACRVADANCNDRPPLPNTAGTSVARV